MFLRVSEAVENGWVDPYPHNDLEHPCTQPCCEPEAYGPGPHWECQEYWGAARCSNRLWKPGVCKPCCERAKVGRQ